MVYQQLYDLFPVNGHLAVVVKPFVRNKKLVDLPQMTLDLLVAIGWEPVTWILEADQSFTDSTMDWLASLIEDGWQFTQLDQCKSEEMIRFRLGKPGKWGQRES